MSSSCLRGSPSLKDTDHHHYKSKYQQELRPSLMGQTWQRTRQESIGRWFALAQIKTRMGFQKTNERE